VFVLPLLLLLAGNASAAYVYNVYGGDSFDLTGDWWLKGYAPADYGYSLLGTSSTTDTFTFSPLYNVFIVQVNTGDSILADTVQGCNGLGCGFLGTNTTGNVPDAGVNIGGPPDGLYSQVGSVYIDNGGFFVVDGTGFFATSLTVYVAPVPAAVWLFGSGLLGLVGMARRKARAA
jgi:hypothetical protein